MANLAEDIRDGDRKAYETFYRLEFNNLVHFIYSYTTDRERAMDLAQEVLCTLWEKRLSIRPEANLRAWVFTIARNRTINLLKERKLFSDPSARESIDSRILALEDPSVDSLIDSLELASLIRKTYDSLPEAARDSFRMSRIDGMTNREISEKKGMSIKSIEYHIRISLRLFREKLKDYLP